jgi:hypothetical protein
MDRRFIYVLVHENKIHYVGKTKNIRKRMFAHKKKYPDSILEIIDDVSVSEWKFWERHYIWLFRSWGFQLDNKRLHGGNGCDVVSEKTKQKLSENWHRVHPNPIKTWVNVKNHSDEARKKMSDSKKGKPAKNKGVPQSEESRLKMSVAKKGKPSSFKGKTLSEGSRLKISNAKKGKPTWNKGVPASDDARRKMSEAAKHRYSK